MYRRDVLLPNKHLSKYPLVNLLSRDTWTSEVK